MSSTLKIAFVVCCSSIFSCEMTMVFHFLSFSVNGFSQIEQTIACLKSSLFSSVNLIGFG